jgi:hypothetical protein
MPTCFGRGGHRHPRGPNPRTKAPLMYDVCHILRIQADSHRIPINTELTEQKPSTPDAAEHRGIQNLGVSACTIVGIHWFVCLFVCVCVYVYARARASLCYAYHVCMNNFQKNNKFY